MGGSSFPYKADVVSASAVAALAIAVSAGAHIKGDPTLSEWVREIGGLPSWRDNARGWALGLHAIQARYAVPGDAELASRTIAQSLFNRVRSSTRDAVLAGDTRARHFHLSMACIAAGSLLGVAYGPETPDAIEAAFADAHSRSGRQGGLAANAARNKLKNVASSHLSDCFPQVPMHEKGAAKGKPDLPTLAKKLGKHPATSSLPPKTRTQWAKEWATEKLKMASDCEA